jgi:lauroyl/myristoyl acyltransferase
LSLNHSNVVVKNDEPRKKSIPLRSASEERLLDARDLVLLGSLPAFELIAWTVPEAIWHALCERLARVQLRISGRIRDRARHISRVLAGHVSADQAEQISTKLAANYHYSRLQILRLHRFGKWEPPQKLIGVEHINQALSQGRGAVLWVAPFVFSDLMTKVALCRHGFPPAHLSRRAHGFSRSRLGSRLLNPILTSVEDRYTSERLLISAGGVLHDLARRLRANQLVAITAVTSHEQRTTTTPFFSGELGMAGGAPVLARRSGAALLPVFTTRNEDGTFVTTIDGPLDTSSDLDTGSALHRLVAQWAERLKPHVLRCPDQYYGWICPNL